MGLGAATLAIAILAFLAWVTFVANQVRVRRRRREAAAPNVAPYVTDDVLEGPVLSRVLGAALVATVWPTARNPGWFSS